MKRGKRSAGDLARSKLLEFWQRKPEFGDPIGCVATTFTFDAAFFEEQCLARFVGLDSDPDEDERAYRIEREEKLSPVFAAVLVDQRHVPLLRSLRWHVLAARVPREGIFHPKLTLLAWQDRIRVIVGSANLNDAGYRRNLENVGVLEFTADGSVPIDPLHDVLDFLDDVRGTAAGTQIADGPQARLHGFLASIRAHVATWPKHAWSRGEPSVVFVAIAPGRPSLFERLRTLWTFAPATEATVMSPFFDRGERATTTAKELESLLIQRGDQSISLLVQGRRMPDGSVELDMPAELARSRRARTTYEHHMVIADPDEDPRPLHAKSIWIQRDDHALHCVGSSNFTQAGTGIAPANMPVNVEANLVYVLPSISSEFGRVCERAYPSSEVVPVTDTIKFLEHDERDEEPSAFVVLPRCFGAATLRQVETGRVLELEIDGNPPSDFRVVLPTGQVLFTAAEWIAAGRPGIYSCRMELTQTPSHVVVMWDTGADVVRAVWSVNVNDTSTLPAPEELRELSLEDLLEVLTSARPAHETIGRILAKREAGKRRHDDKLETDPHKKVDTRHHLLKRMRRAAAAMEELRARLERPSFSRDALRARLHGPLGPLALASKLVAEEPAGAAFMIAELATTINSAKLDPRGYLLMPMAVAALDSVVRELRDLAFTHPAPPNLRAYVDETFRVVCP